MRMVFSHEDRTLLSGNGVSKATVGLRCIHREYEPLKSFQRQTTSYLVTVSVEFSVSCPEKAAIYVGCNNKVTQTARILYILLLDAT